MGIFSILDIGKQGIYASQAALQVASHNITNANTEGYSRQEVQLGTSVPVAVGANFLIGRGVNVETVKRVYDNFIDQKINGETQTFNQSKAQEMTLSQLESIFSESENIGLKTALNDFFNGLHDLANNPAGQAERTALLSLSRILTSNFNKKGDDLTTLRKNLNSEINTVVDEINSITTQIAVLNQKIAEVEIGIQSANDLRDQRMQLMNKLGERIDITYFEDSQGEVNIFTSGGKPLVVKADSSSLLTSPDTDNEALGKIYLSQAGEEIDLTSTITKGALKGLLYLRDTFIPQTRNDLDVLASGIVNEMNIQHGLGYNLDGNLGGNFFDPLSLYSAAKSTNSGTAAVIPSSSSISTPSSLTLDNYEIRFTSSTLFDIVNVTDDTTVSSGNTYTSGGSFTFEGISLTITGTAAADDVFTVNTTKGAASSMDVNITNTRNIAAAASATTIPGDNTNILAMIDIRESEFLRNDTYSLEGFYNTILSNIGIEVESNTRSIKFEGAVLQQLNNLRESVSGVNLEEEMANMLKFQRAFQASARLISITDEMLTTLLNLRG